MYTLSASQQSNFLSTDFMAVETNSISSSAVDGAIDIIKIKAGGTGGANGTHTNIDIRGDGTGGKCSVTVSSGVVTAVTVTTGNRLYFCVCFKCTNSYCWCNKFNRCRVRCNYSTKGGHGKNAVEELGGFYVMLNTSLEGTESGNSGDVTVANDFRKITLIRDLYQVVQLLQQQL